MKVIGITGGVGSGKSEVLRYLKENYNCLVVMADEVAHRLEEPEEKCYREIITLLGTEVLAADKSLDRAKVAEKIFADKTLLGQMNAIVHPAVKADIKRTIAAAKEEGKLDFLFVEAALLIEDGYGQIVDEMWYIHTKEMVRRERLKAARGYTDEKIDSIFLRQLSEEEYGRHCSVVLKNDGALTELYRQIDEKLGENLCQKQ